MMYKGLIDLDPEIIRLSQAAQNRAAYLFDAIDATAEYNALKVQKAFADHRVGAAHLSGSTGYGYDDRGRDTLDQVFAAAFDAEDALVRHSFVSGTHAIATALFGLLRPGDRLLSLTGAPYDTLEEVIGLRGEGNGSLKDFGIRYAQTELKDGFIDLEAAARMAPEAKVAYIQRSRGYSLRRAFTAEEIGQAVRAVKDANPDMIVLVDNCYGEFVQPVEPTGAGADLLAGSLIKNPGGGIARTGGYIAGRRELVELCAQRLTSPGMGREVGCSLDELRWMYQGLFFAPTVVASALKTAVFAASLFELMGYEVSPRFCEDRADIIQAVILRDSGKLLRFCEGIQRGSPVDSMVRPEPWDMPGYGCQVVMAAGTFTLGASIELSADAPMREPYAAYMQGGLTYPAGKLGVMMAADRLLQKR